MEKKGKDKVTLINVLSLLEKIAVIATFIFTVCYTIYSVHEDNVIRERNEDLLQAEAQVNIGNYAEALSIYNDLDNKSVAIAQSNLGYMYEKGLGTEVDYEMAEMYYKEAQSQGCEVALNNLIKLYGSKMDQSSREKLCDILKSAYLLKQDNIVKFALACINDTDVYGILDETLYSANHSAIFDNIEEFLPNEPIPDIETTWDEVQSYWKDNSNETYSEARRICLITEVKAEGDDFLFHYSVRDRRTSPYAILETGLIKIKITKTDTGLSCIRLFMY